MIAKELPRAEVIEAINALQPEMVERVYSGRPGCGCGCKGKYYGDARNIKRVLNAMKKNAETAEHLTYEKGVIAAVEDTRYYWAYLVPEDDPDRGDSVFQVGR